MKTRWIQPITLMGTHVVLEPLSLDHLDGIKEAVLDGELWKLWFTSIPSPETAEAYIRSALELSENAGWMAFVVREKATNKIIGSTRYCNVDEVNQRLEIGYTWYAESYQRSAVNTECKYLLLTHAFEKLEATAGGEFDEAASPSENILVPGNQCVRGRYESVPSVAEAGDREGGIVEESQSLGEGLAVTLEEDP